MKHLHKVIAAISIATTTAFGSLPLSVEASTLSFKRREMGSQIQPRLTTTGDPADYIINAGTGFDGVVELSFDTSRGIYGCTGSLLTSGRHILTAAHCLTDPFGSLIVDNLSVFFDLPTGAVGLNATNFFIHPDWDGYADYESFGGDIAIVELASAAPLAANRYDIYRGTDEIGQTSFKVGYGTSGNGNEGNVSSMGIKRGGQNIYDAPGELFSQIPYFGGVLPGAFLGYDFDNGLPENDAFGSYFNIHDLGLGLDEVNSAPGDSGGPTFINGLIAGVTSFGTCVLDEQFNCSGSDIDPLLNSSFGEFSGDTRVSTYASWIDGIVAPTETVPEPSTIGALLLTGLASLLTRKKSQ